MFICIFAFVCVYVCVSACVYVCMYTCGSQKLSSGIFIYPSTLFIVARALSFQNSPLNLKALRLSDIYWFFDLCLKHKYL